MGDGMGEVAVIGGTGGLLGMPWLLGCQTADVLEGGVLGLRGITGASHFTATAELVESPETSLVGSVFLFAVVPTLMALFITPLFSMSLFSLWLMPLPRRPRGRLRLEILPLDS